MPAKFAPLMCLAVLIGALCSCKSEAPPPRPEQLMLDDYDYMVKTLTQMFPAQELNKKVYNIDVAKILFEARNGVRDDMTEVEFARFIDETLRSCKGKYLQINPNLYGLEENDPLQKVIAGYVQPDAIQKTYEIIQTMQEQDILPPKSIELIYFDGAYYNKYDFTVNGSAALKHGMKLLSVDGVEPLKALESLQGKLTSFDASRKIFYGRPFGIGVSHNFYRLMPVPEDGIRKFVFQSGALAKVEVLVGPNDTVVNQEPAKGFNSLEKTVTYLENEKILYVRIPAMNEEDIPFYDKTIRNEMPGKEIAAVVLDVRGCSDGSDLVWNKVLPFFVPEMDASFALVMKDSEQAFQFMDRAIALAGNNLLTRGVPVVSPFLSSKPRRLYMLRVFSRIKERNNYPVYVISHDIYSAAANLQSMAKMLPTVTTVGTRSSVPLGMNSTLFFFSLPNSKLVISLAAQLDVTRCQTAEEVLHSGVDLEVPFTAADYLTYLNRDNIDDLKKYLVNDDPFFRQILESRKPKVEEKKPEEKPAEAAPAAPAAK